MSDPEIIARLTKIGLQPALQRAPEFAQFLKASNQAWERIVNLTGAKTK
jgi:hypothetical protein